MSALFNNALFCRNNVKYSTGIMIEKNKLTLVSSVSTYLTKVIK